MATYYYSSDGNDTTGDGTYGNPWATLDRAVSQSIDNDTLVLKTGSLADGLNRMDISEPRLLKAESYQSSSWLTDPDFDEEVFQITSGSYGGQTLGINGIVFEGDSGRVGNGIDFRTQSSGETPYLILQNCKFNELSGVGVQNLNREGRMEILNCDFVGGDVYQTGSTITIASGSLYSQNGPQEVLIQGNSIDWRFDGQAFSLIDIENDNVDTYTATASITDNTGGMTRINEAGSPPDIITILGVSNTIITGNDLYFRYEDDPSAQESAVIYVTGLDITRSDNSIVSRNKVYSNHAAGHCMQFGASTTDSYMTGGQFSSNYAEGEYYASATPHGLSLGQGTTAEMYGNVCNGTYIGYLISKTTTASVIGNIAYDCYGSSYYAKGADGATIQSNVAVVSTNAVIRSRGILEATDQSDVNSIQADFIENIVIVQYSDIETYLSDNTCALAAQNSADDVCTFTRNKYYIVDNGIDLETAELFRVAGVMKTLAEWNAYSGNLTVTDDEIILLPQEQISEMVANYRDIVVAFSGESSGNSGGGNSLSI